MKKEDNTASSELDIRTRIWFGTERETWWNFHDDDKWEKKIFL